MRVFVLSTGRVGSTTFYNACKHITNYTCSHEGMYGDENIKKKWHTVGSSRIIYPDNHIHIDGRLAFLLGRLDQMYGKDAFYVHLRRSIRHVVKSRTQPFSSGLIDSYRKIMGIRDHSIYDIADDLVKNTIANIQFFLKNKPKKLTIWIEKPEWVTFWKLIKAKGDCVAGMGELANRYNTAKERQNDYDRRKPETS